MFNPLPCKKCGSLPSSLTTKSGSLISPQYRVDFFCMSEICAPHLYEQPLTPEEKGIKRWNENNT